MEITQQQTGDWLELRISGRLDAYWSDHFSQALDEIVRQGRHRLCLDLSQVVYLSSAGIRVLLRFYKQLKTIQGALTVASPSEPVKQVLELSGLMALLGVGAAAQIKKESQPAAAGVRVERAAVHFELFEGDAAARLKCEVIGEPGLLEGCRFRAEHCRRMEFSANTFALGLGALGRDFAECQGRFGEFLAVGGAAAYLPTDGTNVPDYLVSRGATMPALEVCYALRCEGTLGRLARFEAKHSNVELSALAEGCLEMARADRVGMVLIGQTSGLMGAALRRSPALGGLPEAPFGYPHIREWLTFTAERAFPHALALVVGVAAKTPADLTPLLRPLGRSGDLVGHFHAAAFSYQPIPRGDIELKKLVTSLFEVQTLQGIVHLIADHRDISGGGESAFVRGACWFAPL